MEKVKEARLSAKGQITVPKEVRKLLGVSNGDAVAFYFDENVIKLTSAKNLKIQSKNKANESTVQKGEKQNG